MPRTAACFAPHQFVHGDVADVSFLHIAGFKSNVVYTASPPCVSWSRGGRKQGLASIYGQAFLNALMTCGVAQPVMIALECAAEVPANPHCSIIRGLLDTLGYKRLWDDVSSLQTLSNTARNRWLGVWVRQDLFKQSRVPPTLPSPGFLDGWTDQIYCFDIPRQVQEQLVLTPSEQLIYGNFDYLPETKRGGLTCEATPKQVLNARVPSRHQPLPTLCASYTSQHLLSPQHLKERGIFAFLECTNGFHAFVDPFRFMSLFGILEPVAVSAKVALAFKQIGNAIAVPHAFMTLLSGISSLVEKPVNIQEAVLQAWTSRTNAYTGFIVSGVRFHVLCNAIVAVQETTLEPPVLPSGICVLELHVLHATSAVRHLLSVPAQWTVGHLLGIFRWRYPIQSHLFLWHTEERIHNGMTLQHIAVLSNQWSLYLANRLLAILTFGASNVTASTDHPCPREVPTRIQEIHSSASEVSPTVPYAPSVDGIASTQTGSFDGIVHSTPFLNAVRLAERCLRAGRDVVPAVHVFQDPAIGFTT